MIQTTSRREMLEQSLLSSMIYTSTTTPVVSTPQGRLQLVEASYPSLLFLPKGSPPEKGWPLLVVLHGAGRNEDSAWALANANGEHAGLPIDLAAQGRLPVEPQFAIVAPYCQGKRSFAEEPRSRLLQCIQEVLDQHADVLDRQRVSLFGFSDGATVAVELATTGRFRAAVVCSYGFSGQLPALAIERLQSTPLWVFHSADDVIFPVAYSDRLVGALPHAKYSRFDTDPEGFPPRVRGHTMGITAAKRTEVYEWLLSCLLIPSS